MTKEQRKLLTAIQKAQHLANTLPDALKVNSEYRQLVTLLSECNGYVDKLHIEKPKRYYGSW